MKIKQLETIRLGEFQNIIWVRLRTDEGLVGMGGRRRDATGDVFRA